MRDRLSTAAKQLKVLTMPPSTVVPQTVLAVRLRAVALRGQKNSLIVAACQRTES
jgi:hypothetical protein